MFARARLALVPVLVIDGALILSAPTASADWHGGSGGGGWHGGWGWHGGGGWHGGWGWHGGGWGCCWRGGVFVGVAPPVYVPPPTYYYPPPPYYPYYSAPYGYGG